MRPREFQEKGKKGVVLEAFFQGEDKDPVV